MARISLTNAGVFLFALACSANAKKKTAFEPYPPAILGPVEEGAHNVNVRLTFKVDASEIKLFIGPDRATVTARENAAEPGRFTLTIARKPALVEGEQLRLQAGEGPMSPLLTVSGKAANAPVNPNFLHPASRGDQWLSGKTAQPKSEVLVTVSSASGQARFSSDAVSTSQSAWALRLPQGLECGDRIGVVAGGSALDPAVITCSNPPRPEAVFPPAEGQGAVSGRAAQSSSVRAVLKSGEETVAIETARVDGDTGKFTVNFDRKLAAGENVEVFARSGSAESLAPATASVMPVDLDWGLVRAYFTGGVLLSRDSGSFKSQDPFLSFNLDKSWLRPSTRNAWLRIDTYFDARLAAVAVKEGKPPGDQTATLDRWLASEKAAAMQAGVYLPMVLREAQFGGALNALFVAPLAKTGFSSLTGDRASFNDKKLFPFRGYGVRLGHYHEFRDRDATGKLVYSNRAPELISYLDVVIGPYANLPSFNFATGDVRRLRRASFEGVLKIPYTPFIAGFNANVPLGTKRGYVNADGDLRFLFGTRFDVGRVLGKLTRF